MGLGHALGRATIHAKASDAFGICALGFVAITCAWLGASVKSGHRLDAPVIDGILNAQIRRPAHDVKGRAIPLGPLLVVVASDCASCSAQVLHPERIVRASRIPVAWALTRRTTDAAFIRKFPSVFLIDDSERKLFPPIVYAHAPQGLLVDASNIVRRQVVGARLVEDLAQEVSP